MEALYFFKFWKPNPSQKPEDLHPFPSSTGPSTTTSSKNIKPGGGGGGGDQLEEEGDDSFFELELIPTTSSRATPLQSYSYRFEPSSDSSISKRKVLPIEPRSSKPPQSSISLLKSSPSFKVLTFNKSKSPARRDLLGDEQGGGSLETSNCSPFLGRDNSLRRYIREEDRLKTSNNEDEVEEWKIRKYLKLIYRPLYIARKGKKVTERRGIMGSSPSPSFSPLTVDSSPRKEWKASKKLGKSKSSSSVVAERRDDSLALHHDGIQGAILHCKKSFNSSRDPSLLSRLACEEYSQFRESPRSSSDAN